MLGNWNRYFSGVKSKMMSKRKSKTAAAAPTTSMVTRSSMDRKMQYRTFLEGFSKLEVEDATMEEKMEYTSKVVSEADELLQQGSMEERVKNPVESYLASRVLRAAGQMAAACAAGVSGAVNTYDRRELARHVKDHPSFWSAPFPREAPALVSLFGAFEAAPPDLRARPERRRVERQALAEKKAPANVEKLDKTEEGAEMVNRVRRFVTKTCERTGQPLSYFHAALDPDSFARSVENVYHLSFLVREGAITCHVDEKYGLPFITPVKEAREAAAGGPLSAENQFIVSLDMQRWQELIKVFRIDKPMMVLKR